MQPLPGGGIYDGAHNPESSRALAASISRYFPNCRFPIIYGAMSDKRYDECIAILSEIASEFVFVPVAGHGRACGTDDLMAAAAGRAPGIPRRVCASALEAVREFSGNEFIVTGSLYLGAEVLPAFVPEREILDIH